MDTCPGVHLRTVGFRLRAGMKLALFLFFLLASTWLHANTISGTIKDPKGAVIVGARVEISGGELAQPLVIATDAVGHFVSPDLKPGKYLVRVTQNEFEPREEVVDLTRPIELQLTLSIAVKKSTVSITGTAAYANSDSVYKQLRQLGLGQSYQIKDFTLTVDVGTFHFQQGTLTFLALRSTASLPVLSSSVQDTSH